jgi:uncharacterized protein (DUF1697 family)
MQTYIAILRGINVGGKNKLPMAELKEKISSIGLRHIQNYIQSGNLVFQSDEPNTAELASRIRRSIYNEWGYNVPVLVMVAQELAEIISANPFSSSKDISLLHITFLSEIPDPNRINTLSVIQDSPNEFKIDKKAVYLFCPNGYSKTKLTNTLIERKLKVTATTRNLKTALALQQMTQ